MQSFMAKYLLELLTLIMSARLSWGCVKSVKMKEILSICKLMTPPSLPKGEGKSPFGGFRGSFAKWNFQFVSNPFFLQSFDKAIEEGEFK